MQALASGEYTGLPEARLVFIDALVGWPMAMLYRLVDLPWYGLTHYGIQLVSGCSIIAILVRRRVDTGIALTVLGCVTLIVVHHRLMVLLNFTGTAVMATVAGVLLCLEASNEPRAASKRLLVLAAGLLMLGVSIREQAFLAVFFLAVPLLASRRPTRSALVVLAAAPACAAVLNRVLVTLFAEPAYRDYLAYNELRGSLHSTPRLLASEIGAETLVEVGWTSLDRAMFSLFMFDDSSLFGGTKLSGIAWATRDTRRSFSWEIPSNVISEYPLLVGVAAIAVLYSLTRQAWRTALAQVAIVGAAGTAMTWLVLSARLPDRVSLPLWLTVVLFGLCASHSERPGADVAWVDRQDVNRVLAIPSALLFGCLLASGTIGFSATKDFASASAKRLEAQLEILDQQPASTSVLGPGSALASAGVDPLGSTQFKDRNYISLGWLIFSPMYEIRKTSIPGDVSMTGPATDPETLWFARESDLSYHSQFVARALAAEGLSLSVEVVACPERAKWACLYDYTTQPAGEPSS